MATSVERHASCDRGLIQSSTSRSERDTIRSITLRRRYRRNAFNQLGQSGSLTSELGSAYDSAPDAARISAAHPGSRGKPIRPIRLNPRTPFRSGLSGEGGLIAERGNLDRFMER